MRRTKEVAVNNGITLQAVRGKNANYITQTDERIHMLNASKRENQKKKKKIAQRPSNVQF